MSDVMARFILALRRSKVTEDMLVVVSGRNVKELISGGSWVPLPDIRSASSARLM